MATRMVENAYVKIAAKYAPGSISDIVQSAASSQEILDAIAAAKTRMAEEGRLHEEEGAAGFRGPHTELSGWTLPALGAKVLRGLGIDAQYDRKPEIYMGNSKDMLDVVDMIGLDPLYYKKKDKLIGDKLHDAIFAHEMFEADAMSKSPDFVDAQTNIGGLAQLGALIGAVALPIWAHKQQALDPAKAAWTTFSGGLMGAATGGVGGRLYNTVRGLNDGSSSFWSSHMNADVPRLESVMLAKLNDENLTDIFKTMRSATGERKVFQHAGTEIGEDIPMSVGKKLQSNDPFGMIFSSWRDRK